MVVGQRDNGSGTIDDIEVVKKRNGENVGVKGCRIDVEHWVVGGPFEKRHASFDGGLVFDVGHVFDGGKDGEGHWN